MYSPEVHRTVSEVQLLEQLDFDLAITDGAYQSEHTAAGELRVFTTADDTAIADRERPPMHPLRSIANAVRQGETLNTAFPGTKLYVGVNRDPPLRQGDDAFRDDYSVTAVDIDGLPENGTIEFDADWDLEAAKKAVSGNETRVETREYDVVDFPTDELPIVIRANLYRDAKRLADTLGGDERSEQALEGLAALVIELEHRSGRSRTASPLRIDGFRVNMSKTFPQIEFAPRRGASYDPQNKRVEWKNNRIEAGNTASYAIVGPISELIDIDQLNASIRGEIRGTSLSGMSIAGVFDESGEQFPETAALDTEEKVTLTATIEVDPAALRGEAREVSTATVTVKATPHGLFDELVRVCERNDIHITERSKPGEGEPVTGRDGVFHVDDDPGELDVRREYGDEGVVYAGITVTGRFTAMAEETQVSAFDEGEDRLVRRTEGGLEDQGRSTIEVNARSASSELNSRFISTIENAFGGGA